MELLRLVRLIVVLITMVSGENLTRGEVKQPEIDPRSARQLGQLMCARISKEPYFGVEMLLGKPWRNYYTWNMDLQTHCLDMRFMNATPAMIIRMYNDMNEYLETEPYWNAATLMVRMGVREMLLFADQGPAGRFQGVLNIFTEMSIPPKKKTVPLLNFHLKLLYRGKYLLMVDCEIGVATLSTRRNKLPYRAEVGGIVSNLDIGTGFHACLTDKNKDEREPIINKQ